jgi:hypothetical protein
MVQALQVVIGPVVAMALDWAIYTSLLPYLRLGIPRTPDASYSTLARGRPVALLRTGAVMLSGVLGGLAFASMNAPLWLVASLLLFLAHSSVYLLLYRPV